MKLTGKMDNKEVLASIRYFMSETNRMIDRGVTDKYVEGVIKGMVAILKVFYDCIDARDKGGEQNGHKSKRIGII